ncbi:MAG: NAD(+)/NADH kinase [Fimbriimonadales bacterium]|nr:NAD(+)/NADH kinase [Fimbriimonadales bacterium]
MHIHVVANPAREDAIAAAQELCSKLRAHGHEVGVDADAAHLLPCPRVDPPELGQADLMLSFGGDGTLIKAAELCSAYGTPILGVAYGTFGFVTQCHPTQAEDAIAAFGRGELGVEERMMLQADLVRGGHSIASFHALNEVVVQRSATDRMMVFRVVVDGEKLTSYPADGVLLATPTGSTAYNLSAGGPIVDPSVSAFVMTALAPHSLSSRSLVFRPDAVVELNVVSRGDAVLTTDGRTRLHILRGDCVRVTRSSRTTKLVQVDPRDFVRKLNALLFWSHSIWREKDG